MLDILFAKAEFAAWNGNLSPKLFTKDGDGFFVTYLHQLTKMICTNKFDAYLTVLVPKTIVSNCIVLTDWNISIYNHSDEISMVSMVSLLVILLNTLILRVWVDNRAPFLKKSANQNLSKALN